MLVLSIPVLQPAEKPHPRGHAFRARCLGSARSNLDRSAFVFGRFQQQAHGRFLAGQDHFQLQAGMTAEEEAIRHNHRVSVYLAESQRAAKTKAAPSAAEAPKKEADVKK